MTGRKVKVIVVEPEVKDKYVGPLKVVTVRPKVEDKYVGPLKVVVRDNGPLIDYPLSEPNS